MHIDDLFESVLPQVEKIAAKFWYDRSGGFQVFDPSLCREDLLSIAYEEAWKILTSNSDRLKNVDPEQAIGYDLKRRIIDHLRVLHGRGTSDRTTRRRFLTQSGSIRHLSESAHQGWDGSERKTLAETLIDQGPSVEEQVCGVSSKETTDAIENLRCEYPKLYLSLLVGLEELGGMKDLKITGKHLGVSESRVCQMRTEARRILQEELEV